MIRAGQAWGRPAVGPPELVVAGGDAELALAVAAAPGRRIALADGAPAAIGRVVGAAAGKRRSDLPMDAARVVRRPPGPPLVVVNMVVFGTAPDRTRAWSRTRPVRVQVDDRALAVEAATGVVVAVGRFLRGHDLNPRSHPGDGRVEVQAYAVPRGQRRALRARIRHGDHLPHPRIATRPGRRVTLEVPGRAWSLEVDGVHRGRARAVEIEVVAGAYVLVV